MAILSREIVAQCFKKGADVEISSNDEGFRDSWYEGTVIRPPKASKNGWGMVLVEYKTLTEDEAGEKRVKEELELVQLRPPPPRENLLSYESGSDVDAYYNDGWWEGTITEIEDDMYWVFFRGTREQIAFKASELRVHREWVNGKWFPAPAQGQEFPPPPPPRNKGRVPSKAEASTNTDRIEHEFTPGAIVEVSSDEEGFLGAWFTATVVKQLDYGKYIIQYHTIKNDDDTDFLTEEVDSLHIRPCPPELGLVDRFSVNEEVDALYNDGWWVGVIKKVLKADKYMVYFRDNDEELKLKHSQLRVHQEWINGKWILTSPMESPVKEQLPIEGHEDANGEQLAFFSRKYSL